MSMPWDLCVPWLFSMGPRLHQCLWRVSEARPGGWALALYLMSKTPGVSSFQEFLNRRKMTEFGNLALIDQDAGVEDGVAVPLPGVKKGEQGPPCPPRP